MPNKTRVLFTFLITILVVSIFIFPSINGVSNGPSIVQVTNSGFWDGGTYTHTNCTFSQATQGGNSYVVVFDSTVTVNTISDNLGNSFTLAIHSNAQYNEYIYYSSNVKAGKDNITVTFSGGASSSDVQYCYELLGAIKIVNSSSGFNSVSAVTSSQVETMVPIAGDMVIGNVFNGGASTGSNTISAGSGFTIPQGGTLGSVNDCGCHFATEYNYFPGNVGTNAPFSWARAQYYGSNAVEIESISVITAWNTFGDSDFNWILLIFALLVPTFLIMEIPIKMKNPESYILWLLLGLTMSSFLGGLTIGGTQSPAGVIPTTLGFVFGAVLILYIWKGKPGNANQGIQEV